MRRAVNYVLGAWWEVHQAPIFSKDYMPVWLSGYGKDRKSEAFFRDDHKILEVDFSLGLRWVYLTFWFSEIKKSGPIFYTPSLSLYFLLHRCFVKTPIRDRCFLKLSSHMEAMVWCRNHLQASFRWRFVFICLLGVRGFNRKKTC